MCDVCIYLHICICYICICIWWGDWLQLPNIMNIVTIDEVKWWEEIPLLVGPKKKSRRKLEFEVLTPSTFNIFHAWGLHLDDLGDPSINMYVELVRLGWWLEGYTGIPMYYPHDTKMYGHWRNSWNPKQKGYRALPHHYFRWCNIYIYVFLLCKCYVYIYI